MFTDSELPLENTVLKAQSRDKIKAKKTDVVSMVAQVWHTTGRQEEEHVQSLNENNVDTTRR